MHTMIKVDCGTFIGKCSFPTIKRYVTSDVAADSIRGLNVIRLAEHTPEDLSNETFDGTALEPPWPFFTRARFE